MVIALHKKMPGQGSAIPLTVIPLTKKSVKILESVVRFSFSRPSSAAF